MREATYLGRLTPLALGAWLCVFPCGGCEKRSNSPAGDPSAKTPTAGSASAFSSTSATSESSSLAITDDSDAWAGNATDPGEVADAAPPRFPLALLPLGSLTPVVAAKIVAQPEIPVGWDPATSKPAPWVVKREIHVADGALLTAWDFAMHQAWSFELSKDGARKALWRDIGYGWSLDATNEHFVFSRSVLDAKGEVYLQHVIVDFATLAEHPLPTTDCTHNVLFRGTRVVGYAAQDTGWGGMLPTFICAFELDGTPVARILGTVPWDHTRGLDLSARLDFLPAERDVFYTQFVDWDGVNDHERLFAIDVRDGKRVGAFELPPSGGNWDLSDFTLAHPLVHMKVGYQTKTVTAKAILTR